MALATQCPHCHTTFRVAADQLKLRGGIVRCGACNEVFDGNSALIDLDAPPRPVSTPALSDELGNEVRDELAEQAAGQLDEAPAHELAEQATEQLVEASAEEVAEHPAGERGVESVDELAEQAPTQLNEDLVEELAEQPAAGLDEESAEQLAELAPAERDEEPAKELDEEPAQELAEEPTDTPAEPVLDDAAEASASAAFDAEVAAIDARQQQAEEEPVYTLDFDTTFDPFGILPKAQAPVAAVPEPELVPEPEAEPEFEPEPESEPERPPVPEAAPEPQSPSEFDADLESMAQPKPETEPQAAQEAAPEPESAPLETAVPEDTAVLETTAEPLPAYAADEELATVPVPNELPPAPAPVIDIEHGPLPLLRQAAVADEAPTEAPAPPSPKKTRSPKQKTPAPKIAEPEPPAAEPEPDEPEFVRRGRELERVGHKRRIAMMAGSALLVLTLLLQGVTTFRNVLVARFPGLNPAIASVCGAIGCRLELPAQIEALSIETGELQTIGANTFSLVTLLRNQSALTQTWPNIELELTDASDKPLLRRVFTPADYLPPGVSPAKGFGGRSEQPVKLYFELKQLKASGYHIAVFYP